MESIPSTTDLLRYAFVQDIGYTAYRALCARHGLPAVTALEFVNDQWTRTERDNATIKPRSQG